MRRIARTATFGLALAIAGAGLSVALPAFADPPPGKGKGAEHKGGAKKGGNHGGGSHGGGPKGGGGDASININIGFQDNDRIAIRNFYSNPANCPPGLAKKGNGCMPPGQAKKWAIGRPLPRDVIYYDLPPSLSVQLSVPPSGYKYVRVAGDILMIAVGTGMVVSAVQDLASM